MQRPPGRVDAGSASVEIAIGFLAVVLMIALVLAVASTGLTRARLCDAARSAARAGAAGDPGAVAVGTAALGGVSGHVEVTRSGRWVTANASAPGRSFGPWRLEAPSCSVQAQLESTVP